MNCPKCEHETKHQHLRNGAYGMPETHMDGSERYECAECGYVMWKEEGERQGLKFIFD